MGPGAAAAFLGGLIAGSFACAVAYRVPRGLSVVGPRSMCPSCGTQIAAYDFDAAVLGARGSSLA